MAWRVERTALKLASTELAHSIPASQRVEMIAENIAEKKKNKPPTGLSQEVAVYEEFQFVFLPLSFPLLLPPVLLVCSHVSSRGADYRLPRWTEEN